MAPNAETGDIEVKWTWRHGSNERYNGDTSQAQGIPRFLSREGKIYQNHAVLRIAGERPLKLIIWRGEDTVPVYTEKVETKQSWMEIHFNRDNLPSNFKVKIISEKEGYQLDAEEKFDIGDTSTTWWWCVLL